MSLAAYIWAADLPLDACGTVAYRVLLKLADGADELGYTAWRDWNAQADEWKCTRRTVQRAIAELLDAELIRRGDQRYVAHIRADRRPVVYDVMTTALRYREAMAHFDPVTNQSPRTVHGVT